MLPVVDDALAESDALADVLASVGDFALADDDGLFVGLDEALADAVDTWACAEAEPEQLELGVASTLFLADPLGLGLAPLLALEDVVGLTGGEPPGLALGVRLSLGLALALPDALELALAVPLPVLPLEGVAGAVVVAVALLGTLVRVGVTDGCVDGDAQALFEGGTTAAGLLDGTLPAAAGAGEVVPCPSVAPGPLEELMLKAEPRALPNDTIPWRAAGTADRTTPTANTAAPTAKAGRSMASRQSLGRRCSRRGCDRGSPRPAGSPRRRISLATAPEMASQTPSIPLGALAWDGRDRIFSRIRSRPSEPGST